MAGEKTEKATPRRREDERKKGNVFQSKDLVIVASLITMFYSLQALGPSIMENLQENIQHFIGLAGTQEVISSAELRVWFILAFLVFAKSAVPLLLISALITIVATFAQTRMLVTTKTMEFKWSRLNPLEGIQKMFSLRSLVELLKAIIKISVLIYIIYIQLKDRLSSLPRLMDMSIPQTLSFLGDTVMAVVKATGAVFIFVAAADILFQWWQYEKNIRMSKQEIKEEYKRVEGDPQIKGRIKELQRKMAMSRMMQAVPEADVIIRNPTHYAVAIKYDPQKNQAPQVIAKGADNVALKIIDLAQEHKITITENKPLARGLYEAVEINQEIPEKFYQAVAEVLAFVYSLKNKNGEIGGRNH